MSQASPCDICLLLVGMLVPGPHGVWTWHLCDERYEQYRRAQSRPVVES